MSVSVNTPPTVFGRAVRTVHCVGVGGMGLGPLAVFLAGAGFAVSGEDDDMSPWMRPWLERAGVALGAPGCVPAGAELVVISSAIAASHPARVSAAARGLPVVRRGELLAEVARARKLVAVCGSHGKTTTTAMLVTALRAAGQNPGYVGGGLYADKATPPAAAGDGEWLVAEVDESDGTIDAFAPWLTLVVNLDWDHPDHYRTEADLEKAFGKLLGRTAGPVLVNATCARSLRLIVGQPRALTYGQNGDYALTSHRAEHAGLELALGGRFGEGVAARVRATGSFNAVNACGALAAVRLLGVESVSDLLAGYAGVRRRQGLLSAGRGFTVVEDYAHHPAEITALLGGLREGMSGVGRLHVVFQPHRYSRTAQFLGDFARSLSAADELYLLDVYGAGEKPLAGGLASDLARELEAGARKVLHMPGEAGATFAKLGVELAPGDCVAVVGAGDVDAAARDWLRAFPDGSWWERVRERLSGVVSPETVVAREVSLADKTTMRVGGAARLYAEPANADDLAGLLREARAIGLRVLPLGRGSNLLVPDAGVDALVVQLRHTIWEQFEVLADGRVKVGAGLRLKNLCGLAAKAGLTGLEFLEGIPASVGGALRMNAGAMGGWMFDVVEAVDLVTLAGERRLLSRDEMHVDYRHCAELGDAIALGAILKPLRGAASAEVEEQIATYKKKRQKTQPREPSAGCIFKNPPGDHAGRLIDAAGLKGVRVGDAMVSPVHANFIVNTGAARADDVIALVRRVRAEVERAHGVLLEPEAILYGETWGDVL